MQKIKYDMNVEARTRMMDLTIGRWLEMYDECRIVSGGDACYDGVSLDLVVQMIIVGVELPPFLVFEKSLLYETTSRRVKQLLMHVRMMEVDESVEDSIMRRVLSYRLPVLLVQADTQLSTGILDGMRKFYL